MTTEATSTSTVDLTGQPRQEVGFAWRPWLLLSTLVVGYIGVYICRKNFSVANPLIRQAFGLSREQIGEVASYSTLAYMLGKFIFGPVIDRIGGRAAFLMALLGVAVFGAVGGLASSLPMLTVMYSLNRLAGLAGLGGGGQKGGGFGGLGRDGQTGAGLVSSPIDAAGNGGVVAGVRIRRGGCHLTGGRDRRPQREELALGDERTLDRAGSNSRGVLDCPAAQAG